VKFAEIHVELLNKWDVLCNRFKPSFPFLPFTLKVQVP
jgi:hypothetical protein